MRRGTEGVLVSGHSGVAREAHAHACIYICICTQVRRDKELLSKRSELLALEAERLKDAHAALAAQLRTAQATVASLQAAAPSGSAGQEHAQRVAFEREFGLMRDSNAMMHQRETAREAELGRLREQLKVPVTSPLNPPSRPHLHHPPPPSPPPSPPPASPPPLHPPLYPPLYPFPHTHLHPHLHAHLRPYLLKALEAAVEPLRRDKEVKQREAAALAGQLEEQGKENRQWQVRALTAAALTAAALATAAYFSWLHLSQLHIL